MSTLAPPIVDSVTTSDGQHLVFGEWPGDEPTCVLAHGLTSNHRNFGAVARALDGTVRIVAPDLRGRGLSSRPPSGSYDMERHVDDVLSLMDALDLERAVVGGHSMGAYVATAVAVRAPERVRGLVLLDGGVYIVPPGMEQIDPDQWMEMMLKPVMDRLRQTFDSIEAYRETWKAMPYFVNDWSDIVEDYLRYDLGRRGDAYASKCAEIAAVEDWRDILSNPRTQERLSEVACPVLAVGAETGLTPEQPSVLSDLHVDHLRTLVDDVEFVRVPNTNHHTVGLSDHGARATAEALRKFAARVGG